jgi:hypothetical protein
MSGTKMTVGSRAQVWHGTAKHTSGGLTKTQLMMNKAGRIVSRKKHHSAKKDNRLVKAGYKTKKGHFGFVKVGSRRRGSSSKRRGHKGGAGYAPLTPAQLADMGDGIAGQGITPGGPNTIATMAGGAIYGSDAIGANLSDVNNSSSSTLTGNGIAGAGITDFGLGSIGAQMRAGMAGGKRRKHRGGTTKEIPFGMNNPETAALMAGGKKRRMKGGTGSKGPMLQSDPQLIATNY